MQSQYGKNHLTSGIKKHMALYVMLILPLAYYIIFAYIPMYGVQIAFRDYLPSHGFWGSQWVGFKHFARFFNSYYFERVLFNTLAINIYALLVGFPAPVVFALILNEIQSTRYKKLVQNITYVPHFLSAVVVVSIINLMFSVDNGIVNMALTALGLPARNFMAEPAAFKHLYVWSGIWEHMGWGAVIYIAALAGISTELYEAATIDGASRIRKIWHISIPGIAPTIIIMFLLRCGSLMSIGYEKILLMQNMLNMEASDVISTFVYRSGLLDSDYSFSSAVGLFNSLINFMLLIAANTLSKRLLKIGLW